MTLNPYIQLRASVRRLKLGSLTRLAYRLSRFQIMTALSAIRLPDWDAALDDLARDLQDAITALEKTRAMATQLIDEHSVDAENIQKVLRALYERLGDDTVEAADR